MVDDRLVTEALERLRELLPDPEYGPRIESGGSRIDDAGHDADLIVSFDGGEHRFLVEAKRYVTTNTVTRASLELEAAGIPNDEVLFIAEYIQPAVQRLLQAHRFNYLDTAGNCHIHRPPVFIRVEGRKPDRIKPRPKIRAFGGEGLKVIFAFLLDPALVSETYRDLAELCDVSHGVVQYTAHDLEETGFLDRLGRSKRRLKRSEDLMDRWVEGYVESLRPKLSLGRFRFRDADMLKAWKDIDLDPHQNRWGGEPAADLITDYLRPGFLTLYTRYTRSDAMKHLRLLPDDDGRLELLQAFWTQELERRERSSFARSAVPDLLAYADLAASDDPRNMEVAAQLRERLAKEKA